MGADTAAMRVLYVNHSREWSGSDVSLATLLAHLSPAVRAHLLAHFRLRTEGRFPLDRSRVRRDFAMPQAMTAQAGGRLPAHQVVLHGLKSLVTPLTIARLRRRWSLDLVHVNESTLAAYAIAASAQGLPVAMHVRGRIDRERPATRLLCWLAGRPRVVFIAIDDEVLDTLPAECRGRARVIGNPVHFVGERNDGDRVRQRAAWGIAPDALVVGQVATLHAYKGVFRVLELAQALCSDNPALHFVLVGADPVGVGQRGALLSAIAERGLTGRVHLVGHHEALLPVYSALDIALCLFGEQLGGIGRTAFEAAMLGLPVVATLPAARSSRTFVHGQDGLVFEPDDHAAQLEALRQLLASDQARRQLGARARGAVAARHAAATVAAQVEALYQELLG